MNAFQDGAQNAMGLLYEKYYDKVLHRCLSIAHDRNEAYDLAQDIMLKVFKKINSFRGDSSFSTWLYAITQNHCLDYLRKKSKVQLVPFDQDYDLPDESSDPESILQKEDHHSLLQKCLEHLSETDKHMLLLKYEQNASIKDLQQTFSLGASAVKMRLQRARQKVMSLYTEQSPAA